MNACQKSLINRVRRASISKLVLLVLPLTIFIVACEKKQTRQVDSTADSQTKPIVDEPHEASPLISADELKTLLATQAKSVKVIEPAKNQADFLEGHLPAAQFVHWVDDMTDPENVTQYNNLQTQQFEELMSQLGIENDDHVIIYDRMNSRLSTRLFWTFKFFGHQQVQILDGGFEYWNSKQYPNSTEVIQVTTSGYEVASTNESLIAKMDFVEAQLEQPEMQLVDGRSPAQFSGEEAGKVFHTHEEHPRRGHIPGAINVFWKDNFNEDGTFKSLEDLRELYGSAGALPGNNVITYCNEGLHAAPPWFVLHEMLDYENVRLYDSSMAEWAKSDTPMKMN